MRNDIDTKAFKEALLTERERLLRELKDLGVQNPQNPNDWQARPDYFDTHDSADPNKAADSIESYGENVGLLDQLEIRMKNLNSALGRIENGTFGVCEVGGEDIEKDRLEANPAATTCKKHME